MSLFKKNLSPAPRSKKTYRRESLNTYYRSGGEGGKTSPFKRKPPKTNHRKWLFGAADIILVGLLLAGLVYSLLLKPQPKIQLSDSSYHSAAEYTAGIQPLFRAVKDRNKISFDETGLVNAIQTKYPEVQTARIELPFFSQEPVVWLYISPPAFRLVSGGQSYIVDSQGIVVADAKSMPNLAKLAVLNDQSGYPAKLTKPILSSSSVKFINTILEQSSKAKVPISQLSLPPLAQEIDLHTQDQPYYVKFYLGGDALAQTGQFLAARQKFSKGQTAPSQYLDVRVTGKVFYK